MKVPHIKNKQHRYSQAEVDALLERKERETVERVVDFYSGRMAKKFAHQVASIGSLVLMENWGKLIRRNLRAEHFVCLFAEYVLKYGGKVDSEEFDQILKDAGAFVSVNFEENCNGTNQ